jgi:hypothetical protein
MLVTDTAYLINGIAEANILRNEPVLRCIAVFG